MVTELIRLLMVGAASVLVGTNVALLVHLRGLMASWYRVKLLAVSLLLAYVAVSGLVFHPHWWRMAIGLAAVAFDAFAFALMRRSILRLVESGVTGRVPLIVNGRQLRKARRSPAEAE